MDNELETHIIEKIEEPLINESINETKIKHLVISGGGVVGFSFYGLFYIFVLSSRS